MLNVPPEIPSPFQQHLNDCDECGMPMRFVDIIETPQGEFEVYRCPCGYTEHTSPVIDNDNPGELFLGVE